GLGWNAGRVVSLAATIGTLWFTYLLGRYLYGREAGLTAALVTLTSGLFLFISGYGVLDPLLTCLVVAGIYCGVRALEPSSARRGAWWLCFYGAVGLGVMTKGPVALATAGLVVLAHGIAHRHEVRPGGWWHVAGVMLLGAIVGAWLVPACLAGGPAYTREVLFHQTIDRLAKGAAHARPPYYYLLNLPLYLLPWTLIVALALVWAVRAARSSDGPGLELVWFVVVFAFFSAVSGKRERYVLPIVPAAGLLCGRYLWAVGQGYVARPRWHNGVWWATFALLAPAGVLLAGGALAAWLLPELFGLAQADLDLLRRALRPEYAILAALGGAALLLISLDGQRLVRNGRGEAARVRTLVMAVVATVLVTEIAVQPVANRFKSGVYFAQEARPYLKQADRVYLYESDHAGVYNLFSGVLSMPVLPDEGALAAALASDGRVAVIISERLRKPYRTPRALARQYEAFGGHVAVTRRVGGPIALLLTNWTRGPAVSAR
ncbi:glycosyltransferase family 39 protein, partial [bacterium]|nr:glycosyltransferase family 39 protein [bacterium]